MKLEEHPTVQRMHLKTVNASPPAKASLDAGWLKQLVVDKKFKAHLAGAAHHRAEHGRARLELVKAP
jgi:hypothetical protein